MFFVGQFIEGNILQPRLVGKSVGLHPVWLMFALFAFGALFGFVGLLIAVPAAAAVAVLVRFAINRYLESPLYWGHADDPPVVVEKPRRRAAKADVQGDAEADRPRQLPLDLSHSEGRSRDHLVVSRRQRGRRRADRPLAGLAVAGGRAGRAGRLGQVASRRDLAGNVRRGGRRPASHRRGVDDRRRRRPRSSSTTPMRGGLDETGLFHAVNAVRAAGSHMLLTARRFPSAWGVALPDLASRLKAAATVEIREPDDLLLAGVIAKLFADRQVEVEPHVVQFLVRRIERSLATAIRVVDRLDRAALEQKTRITRGLAAESSARWTRDRGNCFEKSE